MADRSATDAKQALVDEPSTPDGSSIQEQPRDGYGSTETHAFSNPSTADYWRKVYHNANYENRHRFDPDFTWSADEERKLVRKASPAVKRPRAPAVANISQGRLQDHDLGMGHVLRPRPPPAERQPGDFGQHGKVAAGPSRLPSMADGPNVAAGAGHGHKRLQLRPDGGCARVLLPVLS